MNIKHLVLFCTLLICTYSMAAITGFSDDFEDGVLDAGFTVNTAQNPDGHIGEASGVYQMTDTWASPNPLTEIYKSYANESDTSGSFDAQLKYSATLPGGEQAAIKWMFKGTEQIIVTMFTPSKKIKVEYKPDGSGWTNLVSDTNIGYNSDDDLTIGLSYNSVSSNISVAVQVNDGSVQTLFSGTDIIGDIISDRNSVVVDKWGGNDLDAKPVLSIDEWSLTPANNGGGGDGSGGGAGDGSGGNNGGDDNASAFALAFSDDFDDNSLDTEFTINDNNNAGHIGESGSVYVMTDAFGGSNAEIKRDYSQESDVSGSFEASLTYSADLPGNEGSDIKWLFQGRDSDGGQWIEIKMYAPNKKISITERVSNGNGGYTFNKIFNDTDIGYSSGDSLTLGLLYNEASSNITVTAQLGSETEQELYSGGGSSGSIGNIIGQRTMVSVGKFNEDTNNEVTLSIDSWSIQSYTPVVYPDGWGDTDGDGINDAIEALFGGDTSDPSDALTVFAAVTNGSGGSGLTVQEALQATEDARANSMSVSVVDGSATIQLNMETSSNLVEWTSSSNVNVSVPVNEDKQFFRFSFE